LINELSRDTVPHEELVVVARLGVRVAASADILSIAGKIARSPGCLGGMNAWVG